jgi:hypothetical protein
VRAAGHRKNRKAVPLRPVLSIPRGCSTAQRCAADWRPKTSISRIRSENFRAPENPSPPRPTITTTTANDNNKLQQVCKIGGYWVRKPPDSFDVLKKRQGTPGSARFWERRWRKRRGGLATATTRTRSESQCAIPTARVVNRPRRREVTGPLRGGTRAAGLPARRFALLTNSTLQEEETQWWIRAG